MKRRGGKAIILIIPLLFILTLNSNEEALATTLEESSTTAFVPGFYNGNDYRELNKDRRRFYIAGIVDGLLAVSSSKTIYQEDIKKWWMVQCLGTRITFDQIRAIVDKYLNENPEQWHKPMNMLVHHAMILGPCDSYYLH
jgi:hypothetical protein